MSAAPLCPSYAKEEVVSILQKPSEQKQVDEALQYQESQKKEMKESPLRENPQPHSLYTIGALFYTSEKSWSIWVSNTIYNQDHRKISETITVRALNSQTVELAHLEKKILLFVGQSYDANSKTVIPNTA